MISASTASPSDDPSIKAQMIERASPEGYARVVNMVRWCGAARRNQAP